ncbi:uncharacterized protein TRUGW13939_01812 [Talaromyces rugulosus]|uniref:Uncharacterized protein n=1 Tax=Talaromyces rugulosus TaxID=121627 RepID=A0A7H8QNF6_TALRU|nr:uncharacterized protein TRUGW13939_01812 [Talaromyces rugulosus]QKX54723.1 hypothetical protein TRUGW13939_01812 [Talaromyces rugulosus]
MSSPELSGHRISSIDQYANDDDDEELGDDSDLEQISANNQLLTTGNEIIRKKFLNCICDLLSHTKGPKFVTAATLRENEDSIEIDLARNDGFDANDDEYLSSLARFLAIEDEEISRQEVVDHCHWFLDRTTDYNLNRVDFWVEKTVGILKGSPYRSIPPSSNADYVHGTCLLGCCSEVPITRTTTTQLLLSIFNYGSWKLGAPTKAQQEDERHEFVMRAGDAMRSPEDTKADLKAMVPSANHLRIMNMWRLLARPATNLQIISQVAKLLPQFRSVTFIRLSKPAPLKLQKHQTPKISTASKIWDSLLSQPKDLILHQIKDF